MSSFTLPFRSVSEFEQTIQWITMKISEVETSNGVDLGVSGPPHELINDQSTVRTGEMETSITQVLVQSVSEEK